MSAEQSLARGLANALARIAELEEVVARTGRLVVARDGGRYCADCYAEIRRGEAYEALYGNPDVLRHTHCPTHTSTEGAPTA